jgi:hypothetical protein
VEEEDMTSHNPKSNPGRSSSTSIEPRLVREFFVRLASAWGAIFLFVVLLVLNAGCSSAEERERVKRMANNLSGCTASLVDQRESLERAEDMSGAIFGAMESYAQCRWAFRESLEAPPANFAKWSDRQQLDYLSVLIQMREQCEERSAAKVTSWTAEPRLTPGSKSARPSTRPTSAGPREGRQCGESRPCPRHI